MDTNWIKCQSCNLDFHKNDRENHLSGRHHKSKIRREHVQRSHNLQQNGGPFRCNVCKTDFSDKLFYDNHIGSKTHKRNVRKAKLQKNEDIFQQASDMKEGSSMINNTILGGCHDIIEQNTVRKKYKTRYITTDEEYYSQLKSYITCIIAYLSLKMALDSNVQEFEISVNDKKWKSFGDIVINVVYKDRSTTYAIKCKQVSSFDKQARNLNDAKIIMEKEYTLISELKCFDQVKFAIFMPCSTTSTFVTPISLSKDVLSRFTSDKKHTVERAGLSVVPLKKKNEIINTTADCENIFTFFLDDDRVFLPSVYVYTKQMVQPKMIYDVISKKIEVKENIDHEYTKYIENWGDGKLGGFYKLTKKDVILKLGELLLTPYVASPKKINLRHDSFAIWNDVMNHVDLTVLAWENFIISKISQPINKLIEDAFGVKIDAASRSISLKNKIDDRTDEILRAYLFEEIDDTDEDIPLSQMYRVFWKAGKIPILLQTENDKPGTSYILEVICLMKQFGVHKKFLLKTTYPETLKSRCNMVVFKRFEDIQHLVNTSEIFIRVSESYQLSLESIIASDKFIVKWITPNIFFDLALGKYTLRQNSFNKHDYEVEAKMVLEEEDIDKLQKNLYGDSPNKLKILDRLHNVDPRLF